MGKAKNTTKPNEPKPQGAQESPTPVVEPQGAQESPTPVVEPQDTQEGPEAPLPDPDVTVTVDYEAGLNLRDGPHRDYNSLAILPNGTALTVLLLPEGAEVPGWALIRCVVDNETLVGWVCTDFVRED